MEFSSWESGSYLSITPENIDHPERDCDCRIGASMGFCNHFWVGFILSLKQGYLKLSDWTLTRLPADFEEQIKTIKFKTIPDDGKDAKAPKSISLIDEKSDNAVLMALINKSITIYEGVVSEVTRRESEFQDTTTIYYHILLQNVKIGLKIAKKSDFKEEDIVHVKKLKIRISEKLQNENNLKKEDTISMNGKLEKDNFWGMLVKNVRKIEKL